MTRRAGALLASLFLLVASFACARDDEPEATAAAGDAETYCDRTLDIQTPPEPDIDFDALTEEEQKEESRRFVADTLQPIAEDIVESAPDEVRDDVMVLKSALDEAEETGDLGVFETPRVKAAELRAHAFDVRTCGWEKVDVTGVEYAFEGVPATMSSGVTSFDFRNRGKELHEIVILKRKEGVEESFDDILKKEEEQAQEDVDDFGAEFATQGQSTFVMADLKPGDYAMVCFIPVGSISEDEEADGPPHFTRGMKAEFKVS